MSIPVHAIGDETRAARYARIDAIIDGAIDNMEEAVAQKLKNERSRGFWMGMVTASFIQGLLLLAVLFFTGVLV